MTIAELYSKLQKLEVSEDGYYLHGLYGSSNDDNCLTLSIRKGNYTVQYEVYYKEKGEKHSLKIFTTEEEACEYIYERLRADKEIEDAYSN